MENMRHVEASKFARELGLSRVSRKAAKKQWLHVGRRYYNNGSWFYEVSEIGKIIKNWKDYLTEELTAEWHAILKENWLDENDYLVLNDGHEDYSFNFWQQWQGVFDEDILKQEVI